MTKSLKEKILSLRNEGKNYNEISKILKCSKSTISYHCNRNSLGGENKKIPLEKINEIKEFYEKNTIEETAKKFGVSKTTVIRYTDNKRILLTEEEKITKKYYYVKTHRQKLRLKSIDYKGGKCEICGYDKCPRAFDFHHKNPKEKEFTIGSYNNLKWDDLKKELDKCMLLCSNCHRELHYNIDNKI